MYKIIKVSDKIRLPPEKFGKRLNKAILEITQKEYEGIIDEDFGIIIAVIDAKKIGEGHIILGDGAAYYETELELLAYKPGEHEIVEGQISETTEFGAFASIGPVEGLIHVSQIMDEFLDYDSKNGIFIGKESKKKLQVGDAVLARIVTVSLKSSLSDSKIGLTMRQPFLGKSEWIEKEIEDKRKGKEKAGKEGKIVKGKEAEEKEKTGKEREPEKKRGKEKKQKRKRIKGREK